MTASNPTKPDSDGILPHALERRLLWRIKVTLQFTGWLLYLLSGVSALACLLVAGLAWLLVGASSLLCLVPLALGALLLAILAFDVLTVKLHLSPIDRRPIRLDGLDAFNLMRTRRSCRSYQPRDLSRADREELLAAVRDTTRPEAQLAGHPIRIEYVAAPLTVWPTVGGHEFLVALAPRDYDRLAILDVSRALQKVVLQATRMGLGTCWIGPGADPRSVAAHLGERFDPEHDHVICVCAVGYESWFKPLYLRLMKRFTHRRRPLSELFYADLRCSAPLDVDAPAFAAYGRCYEVCQWSPSSYNSQTTRCAAVVATVDGEARPIRFDFFAATRSRYYAAVAVGIWCANWEIGCEALGRRGHLAVLTREERGIHDPADLPHYDISWVVADDDAGARDQ